MKQVDAVAWQALVDTVAQHPHEVGWDAQLAAKHFKVMARHFALTAPEDFVLLLSPCIDENREKSGLHSLPAFAEPTATTTAQVLGYELVRSAQQGPFPSHALKAACKAVAHPQEACWQPVLDDDWSAVCKALHVLSDACCATNAAGSLVLLEGHSRSAVGRALATAMQQPHAKSFLEGKHAEAMSNSTYTHLERVMASAQQPAARMDRNTLGKAVLELQAAIAEAAVPGDHPLSSSANSLLLELQQLRGSSRICAEDAWLHLLKTAISEDTYGQVDLRCLLQDGRDLWPQDAFPNVLAALAWVTSNRCSETPVAAWDDTLQLLSHMTATPPQVPTGAGAQVAAFLQSQEMVLLFEQTNAFLQRQALAQAALVLDTPLTMDELKMNFSFRLHHWLPQAAALELQNIRKIAFQVQAAMEPSEAAAVVRPLQNLASLPFPRAILNVLEGIFVPAAAKVQVQLAQLADFLSSALSPPMWAEVCEENLATVAGQCVGATQSFLNKQLMARDSLAQLKVLAGSLRQSDHPHLLRLLAQWDAVKPSAQLLTAHCLIFEAALMSNPEMAITALQEAQDAGIDVHPAVVTAARAVRTAVALPQADGLQAPWSASACVSVCLCCLLPVQG